MARENYLVFARKWRPQTFEDVIGQEHITRTLQNAIAAERIAHAFLFIGSRGIGKTTTARILAKALNCLAVQKPTTQPCNTCDNCRAIAEGNSIDVIEIDGASNNSVEDVREIREHVRLMPSRSRYKIYIIDEVHQLSPGAFNALLKTIEEPPPHAVFILATTEAHKVPATIISRCQRFDFRRVPIPEIVKLLRAILEQEAIRYTDEALYAVARAAEGGVRDAESILDQLVSYADGEITFKHVFDVLGLVDWQVLHDLTDAILNKDVARLLGLVEDVVALGKDLGQFVQEILRYFRNLLVCKTADPKQLLGLPDDEIARMQSQAERFTLTNLIRLVEQFAELTKGFDSQLAQRIALEALLIRISKRTIETSIDSLIEKLMALSEEGVPSMPPAAGAGPGAQLAEPLLFEDAPPDDQSAAPKTTAARPELSAADAAKRPAPPQTPPGARVSAEEARAALGDPHVAKVVDVFKGKIVDIRRSPKPDHH
ncbi:MAG: DNA polymerase III subunit gamma/tau [Candidatus Hydrogenedentes bacterium]|nr:DNA polymerase III subunit gamma/tau [Candidatus Hydrogenedentota bacterium]